jgi:hypothetical protein
MPTRVRWFVVCLVVSLVSAGAIASAVYPEWTKTHLEAVAWGLVGSACFIVATVVTALAVVANREGHLPTGVAILLGLLLSGGVFWALLWTVTVGL